MSAVLEAVPAQAAEAEPHGAGPCLRDRPDARRWRVAPSSADDCVVVNVQGDEPLMPPEVIDQVAELLLERPDAGMATLAEPISRADDVLDPNIVKLVTDVTGRALYFSRAPLPWSRDDFPPAAGSTLAPGTWRRHLGIYAYGTGLLHGLRALASPAPLERLGDCFEQAAGPASRRADPGGRRLRSGPGRRRHTGRSGAGPGADRGLIPVPQAAQPCSAAASLRTRSGLPSSCRFTPMRLNRVVEPHLVGEAPCRRGPRWRSGRRTAPASPRWALA
ncbi:MAG: hypothetical protein U5R48_11660 [Gammaproteobacteria bacterium]|nr:hypothetical protein [Gammaproteobacteria bacterium]